MRVVCARACVLLSPVRGTLLPPGPPRTKTSAGKKNKIQTSFFYLVGESAVLQDLLRHAEHGGAERELREALAHVVDRVVVLLHRREEDPVERRGPFLLVVLAHVAEVLVHVELQPAELGLALADQSLETLRGRETRR